MYVAFFWGDCNNSPRKLGKLPSANQAARLAFVEPTRQSWWRRSIPLRVGVEQLAPQHPRDGPFGEVSGDWEAESCELVVVVVLGRCSKNKCWIGSNKSCTTVDWSYQVLLSSSWVWYNKSGSIHLWPKKALSKSSRIFSTWSASLPECFAIKPADWWFLHSPEPAASYAT